LEPANQISNTAEQYCTVSVLAGGFNPFNTAIRIIKFDVSRTTNQISFGLVHKILSFPLILATTTVLFGDAVVAN
jgi:hypothetical protein